MPRTTRITTAAASVAAVLGALAAFALSGHGARSQTTGTIKIVVPAPAGASTDVTARLMAEQIGRAQGRTMVVENRPGAGGMIGTEAVSRAAPDGNTLLVVANDFLVGAQLQKANYHPVTSFEPICQLVDAPVVLVVNSASPYNTLADLLDAARAKPGDVTLAAVGPASAYLIGYEVLKRTAKVDIAFVPYPGSAPAINALLGEHVMSAFAGYSVVAEHLKAGKLRALATATLKRIEPLPGVPTVAESGFKDFQVDNWFGVLAPAKTPKQTVSQIAGWFIAAMQVPEVKAKLGVLGLYPVGTCGADFGALLRKSYDQYGRVIREANIKTE